MRVNQSFGAIPRRFTCLLTCLDFLIMRFHLVVACLCLCNGFVSSRSSSAADYKSKPISQAAPESVAASVKAATLGNGIQISDEGGKPVLKIWLGSTVDASSKPDGPKGNVLFPFLSEGQFLGVVEVLTEIGDYRDQPIAPGVYTFRYGIQPINGDHLGASPYRDFGLFLPAAADANPAVLTKKTLEKNSAEAAGTSHPAIMMFLAPPADAKSGQIVRDDENDRTSIVLPLNVKSGTEKSEVLIQFIFQGRAPV